VRLKLEMDRLKKTTADQAALIRILPTAAERASFSTQSTQNRRSVQGKQLATRRVVLPSP